LLVTSDVEYFPNARPYEEVLFRLRRIHHELCRKMSRSRKWSKAKVKLAKAYEHLKDLRRYLYFQLGKDLTEAYDVTIMEAIQVRSLVGKSNRKLRTRLLDVANR
jgi:putative transposase